MEIAAIFALALAGGTEPAEARASVTAGMDCTPFTWVAAGEHERAAMLVPVSINGRTYDFQLDTGADASFISEAVAVEAGLMEPGAGGARVEDIKLGGTSVGPRWLLSRGSTGTVGLDMLVGFTTVIDYPAQRFCVTPTADLPFPIYKDTAWTDAVLRDGKLFVPVKIGEETRSDYFFDTGASLFPLSVDLSRWQQLTARNSAAAADRRMSANSWGARVELVGAASVRPIGIASLPPAKIDVYYSTGGVERFASYPFGASGLFGNAALWDRTVVLTLGSRPQFGIVGQDQKQ
jgi:hypothetical protein